MDSATFELLLSERGAKLMREIAQCAPSETQLGLGTRLRADYPAELVAAALTQTQLRRKAVGKFGDLADRLWYTPDALEQSTRQAVAAHRARRLVELGVTEVVDLGCGIGGDLIAFAAAGLKVRGIEQDPVRAAIARANLAAANLTGTVEIGDATAVDLRADEVPFVDPARRDGRGRTFSLDALVPSWQFVTELLEDRAVAKVMPGIAHSDIPVGVGAEWVSEHGDLVEACLWGAGFGLSPTRRAIVLPAGASLSDRQAIPSVGAPNRFLIEPDDAVIRAGLVAELAAEVEGVLLDPKIAWITCAAPYRGPLGRCFEVLDEIPFRPKQLKAALKARDVGTLTIKKRGVTAVPEQLIKEFALTGSNEATVVLTRVNNKGRAFLVSPLAQGEMNA